MTQRKAERLMNLTILLLTTRQRITKEQIRAATEPYYTASDEAFERMFERDKEELRQGGIPIEVGPVDAYFDDEVGYRIRRDAFELPEIEFTQEEADLVSVAARAWHETALASHTQQALTKLRAAGVEVERDALNELSARVVADEPAFGPVWEATMARQPITFGYARPGDQVSTQRRVQPYRVSATRDRWYLLGHDLDRDDVRMFRLSRIVGEVSAHGKAGSYAVPDADVLDQHTATLAPKDAAGQAVLRVRHGRAVALRRRAVSTDSEMKQAGAAGWDRLTVPFRDQESFVREVLAHGSSVLVEEPAQLREQVLTALREMQQGSAT